MEREAVDVPMSDEKLFVKCVWRDDKVVCYCNCGYVNDETN